MNENPMHPSEDRLVLYIGGELPPDEAAAVRAHLDGCERCASAARELAEIDGLLRAMPPVAVPASFAERVHARLLLSSAARVASWRHAAAAVLLLAAGLGGGWALARAAGPAAPTAIVRNAEGTKFALIFVEDPRVYVETTPDQRRAHLEEFMAWLRSIGDSRVRLGGAQLDIRRGRVLGASAQAAPGGLVQSGFIVIRAASYDEAQAHAERCPILTRGGQVIIRQLY